MQGYTPICDKTVSQHIRLAKYEALSLLNDYYDGVIPIEELLIIELMLHTEAEDIEAQM